jgi:cob(I)alamin adenosyltransferase
MKIYTKTGDLGETSVFTGRRIAKSDSVIGANGALDEATSFIGWAREQVEDDKARELLSHIQHDLYEIMGYVAGAQLRYDVLAKRVETIEKYIDAITAKLSSLTRFILPQGGEATTRLHIARAEVRAAERAVVGYIREKAKHYSLKDKETPKIDMLIMKYLNRLSDLLFTLARKFAQAEHVT